MHGFLVMEFVWGRPVAAGQVDASFLDYAARYLAHLAHAPAAGIPMPQEELLRMIEVNVTEGLGASWSHRFARANLHIPPADAVPAATDGRMMLHEWLRTGRGYLKTDAVDHAADHFSPGCRDTAWDLAACLVEWGLDRPQQNFLLGQYRTVAGDTTLPRRLPFYTIAYLAHRLGYAALAAQMLGPHSLDGQRFQTLLARYTSRLQPELVRI